MAVADERVGEGCRESGSLFIRLQAVSLFVSMHRMMSARHPLRSYSHLRKVSRQSVRRVPPSRQQADVKRPVNLTWSQAWS